MTTAPGPETDDVREALRALAAGEAPAALAPGGARRLVADAEAALSSVESAAAFGEADGFERLRVLVGRTRDEDIRRRAEAVIDALDRYRVAYADAVGTANGEDGSEPAADGSDVIPARHVAADHFHPGHDSHMPGGRQAGGNR
ncbi:hypothetical protein [Halobaculum sp. EA56]|uniref:hypothetical protein n=1 Tax=Halobaculum sp. EA56 TaxID=3421648 RepID=UPI003EBDC1F9